MLYYVFWFLIEEVGASGQWIGRSKYTLTKKIGGTAGQTVTYKVYSYCLQRLTDVSLVLTTAGQTGQAGQPGKPNQIRSASHETKDLSYKMRENRGTSPIFDTAQEHRLAGSS